jgi:ATP-dependent helicase/nuclease subunit A
VTICCSYSEEVAQAEDEAGEEGWISDSTRRYAGKLARQIRDWLDNPFHVASKGRALKPEDILILVRRRSTLAALIVARLHSEGIPVAGVDRLLLSAPLAVQDLLAAARFAIQPLDDLNLASLLVSPLFGWSQDDLFASAFKREGHLWPKVRDTTPPETVEGLRSILDMADYATPHQFFETILSGRCRAAESSFSASGPRLATRSRNCSQAPWSSKPPQAIPSSASSTGLPGATSRSSATLPHRSTRSG